MYARIFALPTIIAVFIILLTSIGSAYAQAGGEADGGAVILGIIFGLIALAFWAMSRRK